MSDFGLQFLIFIHFGKRKQLLRLTGFGARGFGSLMRRPFSDTPWTIPYEFPAFQALVALLRQIGVPFEVGGRLVSFSFYFAILYPLWILARGATT